MVTNICLRDTLACATLSYLQKCSYSLSLQVVELLQQAEKSLWSADLESKEHAGPLFIGSQAWQNGMNKLCQLAKSQQMIHLLHLLPDETLAQV